MNQENSQEESKSSVKNIRKFMTNFLLKALEIKAKPFEEIQSYLIKELKSFSDDITSISSENGDTLAHLGIKENKTEAFKLITEAYISLLDNQNKFYDWFLKENNEKQTILELCAEFGNINIIKYVYSILSRTEENKLRFNENRTNLFHYAAMYNQCYPLIFFYEKLQILFKNEFLIELPNEFGIKPLQYACFKGNKEIVDILLDLGANIDAKDNEGNTCLHYAVKSKNKNLIKKLLIRGVDKDIANNDGVLPYQLAQSKHLNDITELLRPKNCFKKICGLESELKAIKGNRNNILCLLILFIYNLAKFIFMERLNLIFLGRFYYDFVPFANITLIPYNQTNYNINSTSEYVQKCLFNQKTHNNNCIIEASILIISLSIDILLTVIILLFILYENKQPNSKKLKDNKQSLSSLFEENKNVCIKCKEEHSPKTIHCFVCNTCIKNFEHHCFLLNTCITKDNHWKFIVFLVFATLSCILNTLFTGISKNI